MLKGEVTVINRLGLHARAAAQLVKVSGGFTCRITLEKANTSREADAKSMLEVLTLAAPLNSVLTLRAEGEDEQEAFESVTRLFASGFGEI